MLGAIAALIGAATGPNAFSLQVAQDLVDPLLTGAQFIIPVAVAVTGINKLMEHRESAGTFFIEMVTKGGGAILLIQLVKTMAGL